MTDESVPSARIGGVAPPADVRRLWRTARIAVGVGGSAWLVTFNPIAGSLVIALGGGALAMRRLKRRRWTTKWQADVAELARLIDEGELFAAAEVLRQRERIPMNAIGRAVLGYYRGFLCWARGDLEGALAGFLDYTRLLPPTRDNERHLLGARVAVTTLQLELGLLHNAEVSFKRMLELMQRGSPEALRAGLEARHAFAHDRPEELGDAAELARRAELARADRQGLALATIAWAYDARGAHDRAAALRTEARALLATDRDRVRRRYPRTWARLAPQLGLET
jgi:hypothetical protein